MKTIPLNCLLVCCFTLFSLCLTAQGVLPSDDIFRLQNVATGKFLTGAATSTTAVTMSDTGDDPSTHFKFVESGAFYNIDSEILGILRAPGAGGPAGPYVVVSTTKAPPAADTDKIWTISYNATTDTYRFGSNTAGRFMYHEEDGTVTHAEVLDTDDRSNWKLVPLVQHQIPVGVPLRFQNVETEEFLTAAVASNTPVTMSASGEAQNTHWTLVESESESGVYNIDSESESGATGILRATGSGANYAVVSTNTAPPATDTDKIWTISYNAITDTYRFGSNTAGRFMYQEVDGTVTHNTAPDTDDRSNWKLVPLVQHQIPVGIPFGFQNVETEEFLTAAETSNSPVTMSASGEAVNTHWTLVESESESGVYNIDSESESGATGILRATGSGANYAVVSTNTPPPAADTDKIWTISYNATTDTYRFGSNTAGRFMYHEEDGTVTHAEVLDTDDRSNWKLVPLPVETAPDEDTNTDLSCPVSGIYQNDETREVDIENPVNVGTADDRSCYSDYSESVVYGKTWGVYNITDGSNHWDGATLQPRIERSLSRSGESGVGSYARFTGIVRILEVGDAGSFSQDGSYLIQAKGKHTGGGGSPDPAICLYLAKPVYGTGINADKQVAFDIYAERILERGGEGSGREVVLLKRVNKNEEIDFELEIGFREDPNDPDLKIHYCDAVIGGEAFNYNIPDPERGLESGIRYGAYRVKGGRAQFRWANTTYEMEEVVDENGGVDPIEGIYNLRNVETGEFLTAAGASNEAISMSATGDAVNTHWTFVESGAFYNIDSESTTGGTGVLRARGDNLVVSTTKAPPTSDGDKVWTIEHDENTDTYRFRAGTSSRYMYHNVEGAPDDITVVSNAEATDNRSVWEAIAVSVLPLEFISFKAQNINTGTQLNWEIANQVDNSYFEILKGNDLNEFQSIGRVEDEKGQKGYQFLDRQIANQTSFYKIKQVDTNGKFSFSNIISVKSNFESLTLYPNPVGQHEDFTIESPEGYQIFDSKGVLLRSGTEKTIKMDLEKGVYFLRQNSSSRVEKFIVY